MLPGNSTVREFHIAVLGRTLEHLGVRLYKRRDVAIAELVANCWDAGASRVDVNVPEALTYDVATSTITITDDGAGMTGDQVQDEYLIVGRNRRKDGGRVVNGRSIMGRKGIGKLAGFGVASKMEVATWRDEVATRLTLDVEELTRQDGKSHDVAIPGIIGPKSSAMRGSTGTQIVLSTLKHVTPLDVPGLREALGRRFSRSILGHMSIVVNGEAVNEPSLDLKSRVPEEGLESAVLPDGSKVRFYYGFAKEPIHSPQMRGLTVYVWGKTAQAPPFFFFVEGTASGQHGTRYLTGAVEADFLDDGVDDESDRISTDRQEIDWDDEAVKALKEWGDGLTRRALREWANRKGEQTVSSVLNNEEYRARIEGLDPSSRGQVTKFLHGLGQSDAAPERQMGLADSLIRAYEYRTFIDLTEQIEAASTDPDDLESLLAHLMEWKVLESRAILEIIKGRLGIVGKFHQMIVNDAPETAPRVGADNMHDLLAGYPWLINPDWQVLAEEKSVSAQLRQWNAEDVGDDRSRYDFLALSDESKLVVIEIKRSGHPVTLEELQRLERYRERLGKARGDVFMVMICGGTYDVSNEVLRNWEQRQDANLLTWGEVYECARGYYEHYRAVLEGTVQHDDFDKKAREVAQTRKVVEMNSVYRSRADRSEGVGPQDANYSEEQ